MCSIQVLVMCHHGGWHVLLYSPVKDARVRAQVQSRYGSVRRRPCDAYAQLACQTTPSTYEPQIRPLKLRKWRGSGHSRPQLVTLQGLHKKLLLRTCVVHEGRDILLLAMRKNSTFVSVNALALSARKASAKLPNGSDDWPESGPWGWDGGGGGEATAA